MNPRITATAVLLFCTSAASCGRQETAGPAPHQPVREAADHHIVIPADSPMRERIRVERVAALSLAADTMVAPARIDANPRQRARVRPQVSGRVAEVHVLPGERVTAGQVLITLESPEAGAARAQFRQARAAEFGARRSLERARELREMDAVAERDVIEAETELALAQAELDEAQFVLESLNLSPDEAGQRLTIRAPIDGRVLTLEVSRGEIVDADEPVAAIADLSRVWVIASVPETRLRLIDPEGEFIVTVPAFPGEEFPARLVRVSDTLDPETRSLSVYLEVDNADGRLRPEMHGSVQFMSAQRVTAVVPVGTVVHRGGKAQALVEVEPGVYEPREVRSGSRRGNVTPILEGLAEGELVVVDGSLLLLGHGGIR